MRPNPKFPADLVTFTEEIIYGKFIFCVVYLVKNDQDVEKICALWKQMLGIDEKAIFSILYLHNQWHLAAAALKALTTYGGVILTSSFPGTIIFLLLFQLYFNYLFTITGVLSIKWK